MMYKFYFIVKILNSFRYLFRYIFHFLQCHFLFSIHKWSEVAFWTMLENKIIASFIFKGILELYNKFVFKSLVSILFLLVVVIFHILVYHF